MIVVLTGAPGAGKGTQADLLAERLGYRKISTGDALRRQVKLGTEIGKKAGAIMAEGKLVPDDVLVEILRQELGSDPKEKILLDGSPRIVVGGSGGRRGGNGSSSITIMPYMMMPEDHKIAADAIYAVLSKPPKISVPAPPTGEPVNLGGQWQVHIEYVVGTSDHVLMIEQSGGKLSGTHEGEVLKGDLRGQVQANQVQFRSSHHIQGTSLGYDFTGTADGDSMQGTVGLGEYGQAKWTAHRHKYA